MAVFDHLWLVSLTVLMLASQLNFASAAVRVFDLHARDLTGDPAGNDPDPYVKVSCGATSGGQTEFRRDSANPSWSAEFNFPNCEAKDDLVFQVWDKDLNFDDFLGVCVRKVKYESSTGTCKLKNGALYYSFEAVRTEPI
ncbi:E3 ubiquitin-protein ligase Nedd-4 [Labeo rohita]|uniref:E3 ubiquitin-protein ligase Nedd-4 n=1 Tax=Labeo rohita TaxID=84645 RepID=A0ABQ8MRQ7_LABRO|nr:E3 ubiquitin-protein ligase Nedd-4 [Labeo rohita]